MINLRQYRDTNYYVSNEGIIVNKKTGKELKGHIDKKGYVRIYITNEGHTYGLHKIVAECWIPVPDYLKDCPTLQVDHIDGDKLNNTVSNLRWVSGKENANNPVTLSKISKPIEKIDKTTGEVIIRYPSTEEAARKENIHKWGIWKAIHHKDRTKTYKGYIWRFA